jgi:hypothetical protein
MYVEIGTEAAQFPEKEYMNGIFVVVYNHDSVYGSQFAVKIKIKGKPG